MAKVTIYPSAESVYIDNSKSLLDNLRDAGIYVKSSCGGHATCSDCIVKIKSGEDNINTPTFDEMKLLGNVYHITKERLACQCMVNGDIEIDMSNHSKASDEERRTTKNKKVASKFKVRKKEEFDKILEERQANYLEKQKNRDSWQNHWEKEGVKFEKNLGGNKRPKNLKDLDLAPKKNEKRADNRPPRGERPERSERSDRPRGDRPRGDRPERSERSDRPRGERPERSERSDRPRGERPERSERSDRPRGDRTERSERSDRSGRPDFKNKNFKKPDFKKRPTGKPGFKPDFKPGFKKDKKDKDEE